MMSLGSHQLLGEAEGGRDSHLPARRSILVEYPYVQPAETGRIPFTLVHVTYQYLGTEPG